MTTPTGPAHRTMGRQTRQQVRAQRTGNGATAAPKPNVSKTRVGGGFNPSFNPSLSVNLGKGGNSGGQPGGQVGGQAPTSGNSSRSVPGSDFNSNEDIRAFSEHIRKAARQRAVERSMDAEHLESVLRHIPDSNGTMAGALMRARRVSRHLKRIAKAEQAIGKAAAQIYAQFEREYEAELRKVSKARPAPQRRPFGWA